MSSNLSPDELRAIAEADLRRLMGWERMRPALDAAADTQTRYGRHAMSPIENALVDHWRLVRAELEAL